MPPENQVGEGDEDLGMSEADLSALFHHDPLDLGDEASGDEGKTPAVEGAEAPETVVVAPAEPVAVPPAEGGAPPNGQAAPIGGDLPRQIADAVRDAIKPPPQAEPVGADTVPEYMYTIPPQLQAALESEDPATRSKGYSHLISGALRAAHTSIIGEVTKLLDKVRAEVPAKLREETDAQTRQREVFTDFYDAHKDLKNPKLYSFIQTEAMALAREQPSLIQGGWNTKFRDALAVRVRKELKWAEPAAPKAPKGTVPPKMLNGGSRPSAENLTGQAAHLADMFGPLR